MSTAQERPLAAVTGASTGIGRAIAEQLAARGFDLLLAADEPRVAAAARAISAGGTRAEAVEVDLATPEGVVRLHEAIRATGRPLEVAALNAGIGTGGAFAEVPLDEDLRVVDLNVRSVVHLAKLLVDDMVARGAGRLLITSSIAATMPGPFQATYNASKAFDLSFGLALREELRDTGVTVTTLMPGATETEFFARNDMEDTRLAQGPKDDADDVARDAVEALLEGRERVISASLLTKLQAAGSRLLPDSVAAALMRQFSKPGSGTPG